jgi:cell division inhibitor SulA
MLTLVAVAVLALEALAWARWNRQLTPQRRETLAREWIMHAELPSTCTVAGHELSDTGCAWCDDVVVRPRRRTARDVLLPPWS